MSVFVLFCAGLKSLHCSFEVVRFAFAVSNGFVNVIVNPCWFRCSYCYYIDGIQESQSERRALVKFEEYLSILRSEHSPQTKSDTLRRRALKSPDEYFQILRLYECEDSLSYQRQQ